MASTQPPPQSAVHSAGPARRLPPAATNRSATNLSFPQSATMHDLNAVRGHRQMHSSRTWTTSSGELGLLSDTDELDDRALFVQEYNRLAKKHDMRLLIVDDFKLERPLPTMTNPPKRSWISRLFRSSSVSNSSRPVALQKPSLPSTTTKQRQPLPAQPQVRQRRSVSDFAHQIVHSSRDPPRILDLQAMVRLSGKSVLYLPPDFAPGTLLLPTCIRATAQHLAQHTTASGIFRIPGSVRLVNALFDYYCYTEKGGADVSNTVHCANLPIYIQASVHDVASTFKKLLSVLPGGILGTLSIFDAFVAIHSLLRGEPEFPRTKQTKVRARLIALAIGTIQSQFRRELICAVFGLLSLIGRAAEVAPREDENRRPLPTGDLMGYSALGIVFGPLLVGEYLEQYSMNLATPDSGMLLFPLSSPKKLQKGQRNRRRSTIEEKPQLKEGKTVDKIHVANSITEMLIANWRDIVRQMKSLGTHHRKADSALIASAGSLRPSVSEALLVRHPRDWEWERRGSAAQANRAGSPEPGVQPIEAVRQRPKSKKGIGSNKLRAKPSGTILSPTVEESSTEDTSPLHQKRSKSPIHRTQSQAKARHDENTPITNNTPTRPSSRRPTGDRSLRTEEELVEMTPSAQRRRQGTRQSYHEHEVSWEDVPPRTSSKQQGYCDTSMVSQSTQAEDRDRPVLRNFENYSRENVGATVETPRQSSSAPRPRDSLISQGSQASYISASKAVEAKIGSPRREINSEEFEGMLSLPQESPESPLSKIRTPSRCRRDTMSSYQSRASQAENKTCYASHTGQTDSRYLSSQLSEPMRSSSIEATPPQFYAAMKVPLSLTGEKEDITMTRPSTTKVEPTDTTERVPTVKSLASAASKPPANDGNWIKGTKQTKGSLTADRFSRFEPAGKCVPPKTQLFEAPKATEIPSNRASTSSSARHDDSNVKNKRVGVRAMAAMFEGPNEPSKAATVRPKSANRILSSYTQNSPVKPVRHSNSGALWEQASQGKTTWPTKPPKITPRPSILDDTNQNPPDTPTLRTSASDSVALKAAAIMQAEKQLSGSSAVRAPIARLRQAQEQPRTAQPPDTSQPENPKSGMVNLGSWVPHQEQPPVATHLSLARPRSSASRSEQRIQDLVREDCATPIQRPRSTTSLHTQIRNLQRQLEAKTEEASQLKRQLEAQENADVRTLSEQLREAKREAHMWKDRAEAAERRVKVFERFTSRLKGIREAAASADEQAGAQEGSDGSFGSDEDISPNQHVRFAEGKVVDRRTDSGDSGHTEDAGVVTARIRRCLHGSQGVHDGVDDGDLPLGRDGTMDASEVRQIWMAAREFLDQEDGG